MLGVGVAKKKANTSMHDDVFWEAAAEPPRGSENIRKVRT